MEDALGLEPSFERSAGSTPVPGTKITEARGLVVEKNTLKKVWFKEKNAYHCYVCKHPYTRDDIIHEGVKYEVWITLETYTLPW